MMKAARLKEACPLDELRALAKTVRGMGRKVPDELKARAVELFIGGFSANDVALAAGVHPTNLYKWSQERAAKLPFRAVDLHEVPEEPPHALLETEPPATPAYAPAAEAVVFRFPRGTLVTFPSSQLTPGVIEALLCLERG